MLMRAALRTTLPRCPSACVTRHAWEPRFRLFVRFFWFGVIPQTATRFFRKVRISLLCGSAPAIFAFIGGVQRGVPALDWSGTRPLRHSRLSWCLLPSDELLEVDRLAEVMRDQLVSYAPRRHAPGRRTLSGEQLP